MTRLKVGTGLALLACAVVAVAWASSMAAGGCHSAIYNFGLTEGRGKPAGYPLRVELPRAVSSAAGPLPQSVRSAAANPPAIDGEAARLTDPGASPEITAAAPAARSNLVPVDFDISTFGRVAPSGEEGLRASKPLIVGGERIGMVELTLGEGSIVSVDRSELAALVEGRAPRLSETLERLGGDRVTLDALRTRDVRVRYDPLADALVVETAS